MQYRIFDKFLYPCLYECPKIRGDIREMEAMEDFPQCISLAAMGPFNDVQEDEEGQDEDGQDDDGNEDGNKDDFKNMTYLDNGDFKTVDLFVEVLDQQLDSMLPYLPHNPRRLNDKFIQKTGRSMRSQARPPNLKLYPISSFTLKNFAIDGKQLIGLYMRYKKQHPEDDDLPTIKDMDSAKLNEPKAKIKDSSPHHPDYVPWDKAKKHFAYPDVGIGMISIKWREWRLAESLRVWQPRAHVLLWSPRQVDAGIRWFVLYIEAMLAHYTTLNNHAEWRWQVYQSKQGEVEQACKFIATLGGPTHLWLPDLG
ncbi:hypothetical protein BJ742DRAFT_894620 [Cladochytrium replicatum]|nr:hypothetical protein BJ742DRAFT_894620 [Cladochytrium replicatum]